MLKYHMISNEKLVGSFRSIFNNINSDFFSCVSVLSKIDLLRIYVFESDDFPIFALRIRISKTLGRIQWSLIRYFLIVRYLRPKLSENDNLL